ncbi:DUF7196 family protein [Nocardia carnea]|uniref:DUF7196 family protein n=1 Tax=Nocardia carnea TaxID=37328 RepID=UPI003D79B10D
MGCACSPKRAATSRTSGYTVTTMSGDTLGPFLTPTEARIAASAAGGGVVTPVKEPAG